jgi:predicted secreted Zn-dependent protease
MQVGEWGQAGGSLRADPIEAGTSTDLTVTLHGNLRYILPTWTRYANASAAVKAEWDKMFRALTAHEDRHLEIAIEEGNALAKTLVGKDIDQIARLVTAANRRMKQRQDELDHDTQNGSKDGVKYGGVTLDISIT